MTVESAGSWGAARLLADCWTDYRDVCALTLNAMVLGDVGNYRPTIVQLKIVRVR
jgi:hypothetical protein